MCERHPLRGVVEALAAYDLDTLLSKREAFSGLQAELTALYHGTVAETLSDENRRDLKNAVQMSRNLFLALREKGRPSPFRFSKGRSVPVKDTQAEGPVMALAAEADGVGATVHNCAEVPGMMTMGLDSREPRKEGCSAGVQRGPSVRRTSYFKVMQKTGEVITVDPFNKQVPGVGGQTEELDVVLEDMDNCVVILHCVCSAIRIRGLRSTIVYAPNVLASVLVYDGTSSLVIVRAQQLRIHNSTRSVFFTKTTVAPIIEGCDTLLFGSFFALCARLQVSLRAKKTPLNCRLEWTEGSPVDVVDGNLQADVLQEVVDFDWHQKNRPSPNWKFLENEKLAGICSISSPLDSVLFSSKDQVQARKGDVCENLVLQLRFFYQCLMGCITDYR